MKHLNCIWFSSWVVLGFGATALAVAPPPLDRPTPPACCADGICYPRPNTFGWYERRWRRWPTEALAPTPAGVTPPPGLTDDVPPFDLPPVEEEDRRAPPPTMPPEAEEEEDESVPGAEAPSTAPLAPPAGRGTIPTTPLLPFEDDAPGTEPTMPGPPPLGEPATEPPPGLPFGPMGDSDPPPSPTFGATGSPRPRQIPASHAGDRPAIVRPATAPPRRDPANDPPPSLPLSLARAA